MKNESQGAKRGFAEFISGKGFYIVLTLCLAVIGVSVWTMINLAAPEESLENDPVMSSYVPGSEITASESAEVAEPAAPPEDEAVEQDRVEPPAIKETEPVAAVSSTDYTDEQRLEALEQQVIAAAQSVFIRPVSGEVICGYSGETLVYSATMADWRTHRGVDLYAVIGAEVKAASGGTVTDVRNDPLMGTTVVVDHGDGLTSIYSNLEAEPPVTVGQTLRVGDTLGVVGSSAIAESSELSHLHFAMQVDGVYVDPGEYIELD